MIGNKCVRPLDACHGNPATTTTTGCPPPIILLQSSYDTRHFVCHCFIGIKHRRRTVSYSLWPMRREILFFYRHVRLRESFSSDMRRGQRQMGACMHKQSDPGCRRRLLGVGIGRRVKETAISTCGSFLRGSRCQIMDGETGTRLQVVPSLRSEVLGTC